MRKFPLQSPSTLHVLLKKLCVRKKVKICRLLLQSTALKNSLWQTNQKTKISTTKKTHNQRFLTGLVSERLHRNSGAAFFITQYLFRLSRGNDQTVDNYLCSRSFQNRKTRYSFTAYRFCRARLKNSVTYLPL